MKKYVLAILVLVSVTSSAQLPADKIIGIWQCEDYKIKVFKSGNTYSAKLLWSKDMFEADGRTPKRDSKNPDAKLKTRSVQGITHITQLAFEDGEYVNGKLYSIQDGNTYSLKGKLKSAEELETRGYKGVPMLGKTFKWKLVK